MAFLPFIGSLHNVIYWVTGGDNHPVGYAPLPTLQMLYAILRHGRHISDFRPMPPLITLSLIGLASLAVMTLIYKERYYSRARFPLYLALSGVIFFELMPVAHEKHLLFISIPIM